MVGRFEKVIMSNVLGEAVLADSIEDEERDWESGDNSKVLKCYCGEVANRIVRQRSFCSFLHVVIYDIERNCHSG